MKRFLLSALLLLLSAPAFAANPAVEKAGKASVQTEQTTINDDSMCSATAIGPHAIITATHCELPSKVIAVRVGGKATVCTIAGRARDDFDHTIYLLNDITFTDYVDVGPPFAVADDIFMWGNPGDWQDVFQRGYIAGIYSQPEKPVEWLIDVQAFPGESGAGIFSPDGKLVGVLTAYEEQDKKGININLAMAYQLHFSDEAYATARTWTPEPAAAPEKK